MLNTAPRPPRQSRNLTRTLVGLNGGDINGQSAVTHVIWATKGRVPRKESGGHAGVLQCFYPHDKKHVAQKPVDVMRWLLEINTGLVVDPFAGSGTTILAADRLRRPCYAAEMSPAVAAVCLERLAEAGKRPRIGK